MSVQTRKNPVNGLGSTLFELQLTWLWTWSGKSFGYREGDKLYTLEGLQVGRFVGREVYGSGGAYLGETGPGEDALALVTNQYKKSRTQTGFVPALADPKLPRPAQPPRPFYTGHEDFPSVGELMAGMGRTLPVEIQRALRARRQPGAARATSH